jgi:hypothetical protein
VATEIQESHRAESKTYPTKYSKATQHDTYSPNSEEPLVSCKLVIMHDD